MSYRHNIQLYGYLIYILPTVPIFNRRWSSDLCVLLVSTTFSVFILDWCREFCLVCVVWLFCLDGCIFVSEQRAWNNSNIKGTWNECMLKISSYLKISLVYKLIMFLNWYLRRCYVFSYTFFVDFENISTWCSIVRTEF